MSDDSTGNVRSLMERILYEIKRVVVGQDHFLERVLVAMLAREEAPFRVRVNNILPGLVNTDMGKQVLKPMGITDPAMVGKAMPMGRVCEPEDIGNLFAFLASPAGSYITGQSIMVEGGTTLVKGLF